VGFELDKVVLITDGIHVRGVAMMDGIALFGGGQAPAIVNAVGQTVLSLDAYIKQTFSAGQRATRIWAYS